MSSRFAQSDGNENRRFQRDNAVYLGRIRYIKRHKFNIYCSVIFLSIIALSSDALENTRVCVGGDGRMRWQSLVGMFR